MNKPLNTVNKSINEVTEILKTYIKTVNKINTVTNKLVNDIAIYISIIDKTFLVLELLTIYSNVIKDINEDLYNKIKKITDYKKDIESIKKYFEDIYNEIKKLSEIDILNVSKAFSKIEDSMKNIEGALGSVLNIFSPMEKALNRIDKYLYPIKCLLNGLAFLVNSILRPAIDFIMKVTGIQKLLDKLSKYILDKLGIEKLINL